MNQHKSSTRIGNAEREEAQRALHEHLNAGRLQVNEYADRTARAADATTAAEIAVLFTDLPAPRPKLPGSSAGGVLRNPLVIGVAVLALVGLALVVGFGGGTDPAPAPVPPGPTQQALPTAAPTTTVRPTPTPTTSAAPATSAVDGVEVRRTTGADAITLRPGFAVDLDDMTSLNWAVANIGTANGRDVAFGNRGENSYFTGDFAVVTGEPSYGTCARETAYTRGGIELGNLQPDDNICVKTDENRYALVTVVAADAQAFRFRATVWEPVVTS